MSCDRQWLTFVGWVYGLHGNPAIQPMGATYPIPAFTLGLHDGEMIEELIGQGQNPEASRLLRQVAKSSTTPSTTPP
ncbi:MAG: hypothetical protein OXT72_14095 [Gammaproteobacteria bacterium]|nr:hypothetical protein [Gammaproteobacteria bacterium]MDE0247926.1 hypothetical protein [Gammaproteobacteria bacterium]